MANGLPGGQDNVLTPGGFWHYSVTDMKDFRSSTRVLTLTLACTLALTGCSTEVAVSPKGTPIAASSYNPVTGNRTLSGDVKGDMTTIFHATNRALDGLGYFRVKENTSKKDEAHVYARGILDVYVTIDLVPAKVAGMITVSVSLDSGNQPDTQAIFAAILAQVNNPSGTEAPVGARSRGGS